MHAILTQQGTPETCAAAIVIRDNKVLLGLRHYHPRKMGSEERETISVWTTPGGRCDEGECIRDTLTRETYEEIGVREITIHAHIATYDGAKEGDTVHAFHCEIHEEPQHMEPEKFSEWRWFSLNELPENIINAHTREAIARCLTY